MQIEICDLTLKLYYNLFVLVYRGKRPFDDMMPDAPKEGVDLMKKLLHFNPDKRISVDEALRHPFVAR